MPSPRAEGWKRKQSTAHHGQRAGEMLLPQLRKLPSRGSLSSHSPGRKSLCKDFGGTGLGPKPFKKDIVSRSCCTQPLPEPRSLSRAPGCLQAASTPWTHSAPLWQGAGFEVMEPLCLSSPVWEAPRPPHREQSLRPPAEGTREPRRCWSWGIASASHGPGTHTACLGSPFSFLLLPAFLQTPRRRETKSANANPSFPFLLLFGFC